MCDGSCCIWPMPKLATIAWRPRALATLYLGISTPGLQSISRSPKCSLPSRYCSGFPRPLSWTSRRRKARLATVVSPRAPRASATCSTCSRSHRSSLRAVPRSRHGARRAGRRESIACALRSSDLGMRGMSAGEFGTSCHLPCRFASAPVISSCTRQLPTQALRSPSRLLICM